MNKKWKKKWISALTSGKNKQTQEVMKDNNGYCCLGVLRKVMHPGSSATNGEESLRDDHREEAGLTIKETDKLITLNDTKGYDFTRIAKWVDKHL